MRGTISAAVLALLGSACADWTQDADFTEHDWAVIERMELPALPEQDERVARLGQALFFDSELSGPIVTSHDGQPRPLTAYSGTVDDAGVDAGLALLTTGRVSCADCHLPEAWFSDDRSSPNNVSLGVQWTTRNSPSLVNVGHYTKYFSWDGRAETLADQSAVAYTSARAMGGTSLRLARVVLGKYGAKWLDVFPDAGAEPLEMEDGGVSRRTNAVARQAYAAMAAYMMRLESRNAPIDRFATTREGLSEAARKGLKLFIGKAGCIECHAGPAFTDHQFHNIGVAQRGEHVPAEDRGRYEGLSFRSTSPIFGCERADAGCETNDDSYIGRFRTKSLRQVAQTGPYMHAGQLATLADVVHFYNVGGDPTGFVGTRAPQLVPLGLTLEEEGHLVAFLEALTGEPVAAELRCDNGPDGGVKRYPRCDGGL